MINGTAAAPVVNVTFDGITFGETAPTFLQPYERPISGDWAIHRGGTVHVRHATVEFMRSNWSRTGGNGLLFSHAAKNCSVTDSEFFSIGDSAVVAYGEIDWESGDAATGPGYPSGLRIERNLMHEIGIWGKQVSCFFQGISGNNRFVDNVCFNGPRALVNVSSKV
jgi:hypothetical protein